jgi:hypothetical protein
VAWVLTIRKYEGVFLISQRSSFSPIESLAQTFQESAQLIQKILTLHHQGKAKREASRTSRIATTFFKEHLHPYFCLHKFCADDKPIQKNV